MKKLFVALVCLASVATLHAQSADEIVAKYATAMGGLDNFNKVKTAKYSGTVSAQGDEVTITIQIVNGKAMRSDVEVMGQSITNVYNNGTGWKINPFAGATTATDATAAELPDLKTQSYIANQLMNYKARGFKIESAGEETVDGVKTNKIKLTTDDGKVTTYFIDANTSMLVKSVATRNMMGQDAEVETYYSDVKEINGIKFPMTRIQKIEGETFQEVHFEKVELDVPIDDKIFVKQ